MHKLSIHKILGRETEKFSRSLKSGKSLIKFNECYFVVSFQTLQSVKPVPLLFFLLFFSLWYVFETILELYFQAPSGDIHNKYLGQIASDFFFFTMKIKFLAFEKWTLYLLTSQGVGSFSNSFYFPFSLLFVKGECNSLSFGWKFENLWLTKRRLVFPVLLLT